MAADIAFESGSGCGLHGGLIPAQEWVGGKFKIDGGGNSRQIAMPLGRAKGLAQFEIAVAWFYGLGELDIGHRVFVRAIHFGLGWQALQLCKRSRHLLCGAFKQAPATTGKQRIATEQHALSEIRDVAGGVAGNIQDIKREFDTGNDDAVTLA